MPVFEPAIQARLERLLRPLLVRLPPALAVRLYSAGRRRFGEDLARSRPRPNTVPEELGRELWGLRFRSPLANAAGMFKNGDGYELVAAQGAGSYLAGTTTGRKRAGNRRGSLRQPFAPYPASHAASNWLGLPNVGHREAAAKLAALERVPGCPVGASLAACPDPERLEEEKLEGLVEGLWLYEEAGVDFLEINESCPNTPEDPRGLDALRARLTYLTDSFLDRRRRHVPVVVKFSCDTEPAQVGELVDLLTAAGFDGINFGNTSTDYAGHRGRIARPERRLYDHFTERYGGGVSGRPLAKISLRLAELAVQHLERFPPEREFYVIRTGGLETAADVERSERASIALNQWYTGYFEALGRHGHDLYRQLYEELCGELMAKLPTPPGAR